MEKKMNSVSLTEDRLGYHVIDALTQANVDLRTVTLEQAKSLLVRIGREHRESSEGTQSLG